MIRPRTSRFPSLRPGTIRPWADRIPSADFARPNRAHPFAGAFAPSAFPVVALALALALLASGLATAQSTARGVVFHDRNRNGVFDAEDAPLGGVLVSNGVEVVRTDSLGRYALPVTDDTVLFVVKPRGFRSLLDENNLPRFHYIHKPQGSPSSRFPGVAPTGPLPESIDFPLHPQTETDTFRAVFFADTQPRTQREIHYIMHDVLAELVDTDAAFGVTLGDIVFDNLELLDPINAAIGRIGVPWYNVIGNHDYNHDSRTDELAAETFQRIYGPRYYAFEYGPVHFIAMDTVVWSIPEGESRGRYISGIDPDQLAFIENYLAHVPKNRLVVLMMHIPLTSGNFRERDRQRLFSLLADRRNTFSISGHTHYQQHVFMGENYGWRQSTPHHHLINATVCGSWWGGAPDELGIPHSMMRDGAPNGYSIITFSGTRYDIAFKAPRRPADYQMNIFTPETIPAARVGQTEAIVNVFAGSEKCTVEMRVGDRAWAAMTRYVGRDPYFMALKRAEESDTPPPGRKLPNPHNTPHLWKANLPEDLEPGKHALRVRVVDQFGKRYQAARILHVVD